MSLESVPIVVIGGGQAGLAVAWHLQRAGMTAGRDFQVVDAAERPGGAWAGMWPGMRLFSPAHYSSLPGMPMPAWQGEGNPNPAHVADYLTQYEQRYRIDVRRGVRVLRLDLGTTAPDAVRIETSAGVIEAQQVINATGSWTRPFAPSWPGLAGYSGRQLHTVHYSGPEEFAGQRVAVVGGGNSGAQIMAEIAPVAADSRWITRRPPRFLPDDVDGEALFEIASARYRVHGEPDGPSISDLGDIVAVDTVRRARAARHLVAHRPFQRFDGSALVWDEPEVRWEADAVIWATGFRPALRHLRGTGLLAPTGEVKISEGQAVSDPRLHFVGYGDWCGPASATLVGVGQHAKTTAHRVCTQLK